MADEATEAAEVLSTPSETPGGHRHLNIRDLRLRVLSGSATMLLSSVLVSVINLIYNFAIAHALGADNFGHVSVVYTILMLLSCATLAFQLLCSKFVARSESQAERIAIYHLLHRRSWMAGLGVGLLLAAGSSGVSHYLNLPSPLLIQVLAIGIVFYIPLGTRRGFMQGTYDFVPLAANYVLEVVVKLIGTVILIWAGYGVPGVVGAMSASVIVAFFVAIPRKHPGTELPTAKLESGMVEGVQALIFFVGQVVIGNLHIVLVKHFFDATQAGVYAAVALIGRVAYMFSWSVVSSMFPFSAGIRSGERGGRTVLSTALLLTAGVSTAFTLAAWLAPSQFWPLLLGRGFPVAHHYSSLVVLYTIATGIYSLSVVLMTYEISRKIGNVSWLQLGFSGAIVVGIYIFHSSLQSVIYVQLVLMAVLMLVVSLPFLRRHAESESSFVEPPLVPRFESGLRKLRPLDENEVIAEFLRGEFYQDEFRPYRKRFSKLVTQPDLTNERENSLRRALLYRRRGRLWMELPVDTQWWEVELSPFDIYRMRVFPRNQWLRYGAPSFLLPETVQRIRTRILSDSKDPFIGKVRSLSLDMKHNNSEFSSVILITIDEHTPLTIIEGNHRMTAAALGVPEDTHRRFRFMCGFSPRMAECCWYQTDVTTLWRYAKNTIGYYVKHRRKVVAEIAAGILPDTEVPKARNGTSSAA
jgi:O-antigen/teichoic acid export membrane protein